MGRKLLTEAASEGLLAESALIAHGRGEAYDYLIGERTMDCAAAAVEHAAAAMLCADSAVISVNGNTVALAGRELIRIAAIIGCPIEVNIYYRTDARMSALLSRLHSDKEAVLGSKPPLGWSGNWVQAVSSVRILGEEPDGKIPGLEGPRANCCTVGILSADVVFVPLEDGDRCEALVAMGKCVIVVDLNPLSRTAKTATITIVDELMRMVPKLESALVDSKYEHLGDWDNLSRLDEAINEILLGVGR